jgi:hypothetical protein
MTGEQFTVDCGKQSGSELGAEKDVHTPIRDCVTCERPAGASRQPGVALTGSAVCPVPTGETDP